MKSKIKLLNHTGKIGRSESYSYRGEPNHYPLFDMLTKLNISDYNVGGTILTSIVNKLGGEK